METRRGRGSEVLSGFSDTFVALPAQERFETLM
jgi:hypothetical protein